MPTQSDPDLPTPTPTPVIPDLVQRYLNGESIQSLADNSQHCFRTIYHWLLRECGPEYEHVQTQALINRIADADYQLDIAASKVSVARAREQAKFARMDFERRRPKLYGPKQEVSVDEKITVIVQRHPTPQHIGNQPSIIPAIAEVIDNTENKS